MKKLFSFLLALCSLFSSADSEALIGEDALPGLLPEEFAQEQAVETSHSVMIGDRRINYTATAGTMIVSSGGEQCEIFYTAYTRDEVDDLNARPITFAFNGGPGSASLWLHMGLLGPRRMELDDEGRAAAFPAALVDNEESILDLTDLVFIDPVGTGYSRAVNGSSAAAFLGYENDIRSVGDFIRLYVNRSGRWGSPKYLAGESYGTTRAVGVCEYLHDVYGMGLNGLMLISCANDFTTLIDQPGNDLPYAIFLPTYAADAWYHGVLKDEYQDMELEAFLEEVRQFVRADYVPALFRGRSLSKDEMEQLAEQLAAYTGLSKELFLSSSLRVNLDDFCFGLLADDGLAVGRLDGRVTGPVTGGSLGEGASDPSMASEDIIFTAAVNQYMTNELEYQTDLPYIPLSGDVSMAWSMDSDNAYLAQENTIFECMCKNSFLKVWVLSGYYDGATPFFGTEWIYDHVFLGEEQQKNLTMSYYPSGHMFYLNGESRALFREQAEDWYGAES